jgi:hypothetical protein
MILLCVAFTLQVVPVAWPGLLGPWIFSDYHISTSGTRQTIILVCAIGPRTPKNAQMPVLILLRSARSTDGWKLRKPIIGLRMVTNNWIFRIDLFDMNRAAGPSKKKNNHSILSMQIYVIQSDDFFVKS